QRLPLGRQKVPDGPTRQRAGKVRRVDVAAQDFEADFLATQRILPLRLPQGEDHQRIGRAQRRVALKARGNVQLGNARLQGGVTRGQGTDAAELLAQVGG